MVTLSFVNRFANYVTLAVGDDQPNVSWQIEANRMDDFASDESILVTIGALGAQLIYDLTEDTPYYFRARGQAVAGTFGAWSDTLMLATAAGAAAAVPAYSGFSVVPAKLIVPEPVADLVATNLEPGSLPENLLNDDPTSTLRISGATSAITFRTTGRPIDTIALLGTLANEQATWRVRSATTPFGVTNAPTVDTGVVQFRTGNGLGRRAHYHGIRFLNGATGNEYWRIDLAGFNNFFVARNLVVGMARSSVNISRGQGHEPSDGGTMSRTLWGAPDRVRGWRARKVEFPLSWISETEYEAKWRDLDQLVGTTDPVLAFANPKLSRYLNDRVAYGTITSMRGELMRGDKYARSIDIGSLY